MESSHLSSPAVFPHEPAAYRGRIAPSPTGFLHIGHAATFLTAARRAERRQGELVFRCDDLDLARCKPLFSDAAVEDLRWMGINWQEGPDIGGPFAPYAQSQRLHLYREAMQRLLRKGLVYACRCSRKEVASALGAPHPLDEEPVYPGTCRPRIPEPREAFDPAQNWRFRIPSAVELQFNDGLQGPQHARAGVDFGDFLVWRKDGFPSYQLASAFDDSAFGITEVVRGSDLITSTFRQLLLWEAMDQPAPRFFHCNLVTDSEGRRLAKRAPSQTLRELRAAGRTPGDLAEELRGKGMLPDL